MESHPKRGKGGSGEGARMALQIRLRSKRISRLSKISDCLSWVPLTERFPVVCDIALICRSRQATREHELDSRSNHNQVVAARAAPYGASTERWVGRRGLGRSGSQQKKNRTSPATPTTARARGTKPDSATSARSTVDRCTSSPPRRRSAPARPRRSTAADSSSTT